LIWIRALPLPTQIAGRINQGLEMAVMTSIVTLTMNPALDMATATEIVTPTEKLRCGEPRYDPGGGGINVARAVRLLGGEARAIFPNGGMSGETLCGLLKKVDVPHTPVPISGITRESFAVVERRTGKQYRFLLPGPVLSPDDQERCLVPSSPLSAMLLISWRAGVYRSASLRIFIEESVPWLRPIASSLCSTRRGPPSPQQITISLCSRRACANSRS
jgi:hypothetical protein